MNVYSVKNLLWLLENINETFTPNYSNAKNATEERSLGSVLQTRNPRKWGEREGWCIENGQEEMVTMGILENSALITFLLLW